MYNKLLKCFVGILIFFVIFATKVYADNKGYFYQAENNQFIIYKTEKDWTPIYEYDAQATNHQSNHIIAKFPKNTQVFPINEKVAGKYLVTIDAISIMGWVDEKDVIPKIVLSKAEQYSITLDMFVTQSSLSAGGTIPITSAKYIDDTTIGINVAAIWNAITPKYQKLFQEAVLYWWVRANDFDNSKPYCVKFYYKTKELGQSCSNKELVRKFIKDKSAPILDYQVFER